MRRITYIVICAALAGLSACAPADLLNLTVKRGGYDVTRDIAYGSLPRQQLDIYVPEQAANAPVVVFFHGGSWQKGDKSEYRFVGQALASKGFITVVANYRLHPQVFFPDFLEDSAQAVAWVHQHIAHYGGNASKVFAAGHSAGAYNAMMITVNDAYIRKAGGNRSWIHGVIGIAGPYDFLPFTDSDIAFLFSTAPEQDTQPINYVKRAFPPMLLVTGDDDAEVLPKNTQRMAERLRRYRSPVVERIYPDVGHTGIMLSLAWGFRGKAPLLNDITEFVTTH